MLLKKYVILAHREAGQLKRMIDRHQDGRSHFFIHLDIKTDIAPFKELIQRDNVTFIASRVDCIWGDFSIVEATINLFRAAVDYGYPDSKIILLSGQDYPIKPASHINKYLDENADFDFIDFCEFPASNYKQRVLQYKVNFSSNRGDFVFVRPVFASHIKNFSTFLKLVKHKRIPAGDLHYFLRVRRKKVFKEHFKGSAWCCLNHST